MEFNSISKGLNVHILSVLLCLVIGYAMASDHGEFQDISKLDVIDTLLNRRENLLQELIHRRERRQKQTEQHGEQRRLTIELGVTMDKRTYGAISKTSDPEKYVFDVIKIVDRRSALLNISVVLSWLELWDKKDLMKIDESRVLPLLKKWTARREVKVGQPWTDMDLLITGYNFAAIGDPINGLATRSSVCLKEAGVVVIYTGQSLTRMAQTVLHELGHTLGMEHDNETCCLEGYDKCAMGLTLNDYQVAKPKFSPCSLATLSKFLESDQSTCLENIPTKNRIRTSHSLCGNGVIDSGEECDCGGGCLYGCCGCCKQCRFIKNAKCAAGPCCDTSDCQFRPSTFVCKNETLDSCNPVDYCTGENDECPEIKAANGEECSDKNNVKSICLEGRCLTRTRQCQQYWNDDYEEAVDKCYMAGLTMVGRFAHCGKKSETSYTRCMPYGSASFYKCGMLQCKGPGDNLYDAATHKQSPQKNTFIHDAKCLSLSHGPWENMEGNVMVTDGTNCGENKMCYHGNCLDADTVLPNILNATEIEQNITTSFCGNGIVEGNEECDCGPKQCDCCNISTCKFLQNGVGCYSNECYVCNGTSHQCSKRLLAVMTSCDNGNGQCYYGQCSSLEKSCKKYYGDFATPVSELYPLNANHNSSRHNGGGYLLFNRRTQKWHNFYEFQTADNDGTCGILYCNAYVSANITDENGRVMTSKTVTVNNVNSHRVAYFTFETTRDGMELYDKYYPLLTDNGTPCTKEGQNGYCVKTSLLMDRRQWNWYWAAKCIVPQSS